MRRVRTAQEVKDAVLKNFQRDFPGEDIHLCPFSIYILDVYCRTMENYELCRQILKEGD